MSLCTGKPVLNIWISDFAACPGECGDLKFGFFDAHHSPSTSDEIGFRRYQLKEQD